MCMKIINQEDVELINEVGSNSETWCLVLDSHGISGYVNRRDLTPIDEKNERFYNTNSSSSDLETLGGFKVGDNAIEVLNFYESKYERLESSDDYYWHSENTFILQEGHFLEFFIDTDELNDKSVIRSISIDWF